MPVLRRLFDGGRVALMGVCISGLLGACTRTEEQAPAQAPVAVAPPQKGALPPPPRVSLDTMDFAAFQAKFAGLRQPTTLVPKVDYTPEKLQRYPFFGRTWLRLPDQRIVELATMEFYGISFFEAHPGMYQMLAARQVPDGVMVYMHTFDKALQQVGTFEMARYWARDLSRIEKNGFFTDARNYTATYVFYENYTRTDSVISNLFILDDGRIKVMGESVY